MQCVESGIIKVNSIWWVKNAIFQKFDFAELAIEPFGRYGQPDDGELALTARLSIRGFSDVSNPLTPSSRRPEKQMRSADYRDRDTVSSCSCIPSPGETLLGASKEAWLRPCRRTFCL